MMPMNENEEIKRDKHRILVLQRALLLQARRQHLPIDVITPERRVQRWIEDAEESLNGRSSPIPSSNAPSKFRKEPNG